MSDTPINYQGKLVGRVESSQKHRGMRYTAVAQDTSRATFKTFDEARDNVLFIAGMYAAANLSEIDNAVRRDAQRFARDVEQVCKTSAKHLMELRITLAWIWDADAQEPKE